MSIEKKLLNVYTFFYLIRLKKTFAGDPAKIKADQNKKIHRLMKRAYKIPFYRAKFEESGTTPDDYHCSEDLVKFPTMNKAELRLWMEKEWNEHPEKHDSLNVMSTSGSSGVPLKMLYTQKEQAFSNANWIRVLQVAGYRPLRGKMYSNQTNHKDTDAKKGDSIIQKFGLMRRRVVSEDTCVGDGIADTIRDINEYKPDMLRFRRNCMVRIAVYAKQHNMELWKPKYYAPVSEMVDDVTRNILTEMLGPGLIDAYGVSEMGSCVYKYPGDDFYYVANDIAVANVYDDNNQLADNGRIVLTSLYKKTYPLINYDVLDIGKSYVKDGLRYFTAIEGRMNDVVKHEDGVESSAVQLMRIANGTVGLSQFRFVQESYHDMLIQLAPDPNNTSKSREEIEEHFVSSVKKLFGDEFKIRVEWMDMLPPDKTGKQRCFVCNVK
ncbi:MAG: hypothetical protein Q4F83_00375 [Eubacteriales bacterium]|nr:hypothetical protein [Eubacteriales bacterium]